MRLWSNSMSVVLINLVGGFLKDEICLNKNLVSVIKTLTDSSVASIIGPMVAIFVQ